MGGAEESFGSEVGNGVAGVEEDDAVGEVEGFVEVVGDEKNRLAEALEKRAHHLLHFEAGEGVECPEGFVHEEDGRVGGEGAGESCTLALATGELAWITAGEGGGVETDGGEEFVGAANALVEGDALGFEDEGDIAFEGEMREEADLLDDIADGSAEGDEIAVEGVDAGEEDFAACGLEKTIDCAEEGCFAGAAAAEDGGGGAFVECERDAVEEEMAAGKGEGEVAEVDCCGGQFRTPSGGSGLVCDPFVKKQKQVLRLPSQAAHSSR